MIIAVVKNKNKTKLTKILILLALITNLLTDN